MARTPYSNNSYVGGAPQAVLSGVITATATTIYISGTTASGWSPLGQTGGFVLALDYQTSNEEKVWVPSGSYAWGSPTVTLSNIERAYDGTGLLFTVSGFSHPNGSSVVHVLAATDLDEANNLVSNVITPSGFISLSNTRENVNIITQGISGTSYITNNVNTISGSVYFWTIAASGNFFVNITYSGATALASNTTFTLGSGLSIGQSITVTVLTTQGATAYPASGIAIDGVAGAWTNGTTTNNITTYWQGGTAPSTGNSSGIDGYTFAVIKTANPDTYTVLASQTKF